MRAKPTNILVVEDDKDIANLICLHLNDLEFQCDWVLDGMQGYEKASSGKYGLIILDLMLPGMDGYEICKSLRTEKIQTPILMLTAKGEEIDKVLGLEFGADDYLAKPFGIREFVARVKAIVRRNALLAEAEQNSQKKILKIHSLLIEIDKRKVLMGNEVIDLTAKEFDLLALFASNPGRVYSRQQLLDIVWGYQFDGYDHTVNSHINRLRTKIEADASNPKFIQTVWGVGYKFAEEEH